MTFVTLTDHWTIDGALELAGQPDFIVGEEISIPVTDGGRAVDVVVLGLDEANHRELAARRGDRTALLSYLRSTGLVHFLAHPTVHGGYPVGQELLTRLARDFPLWETRNGSKPEMANEVAASLRSVSTASADVHRAEIGQVGGSDDHSGFDVGKTYTVTPPARDVIEFLAHLRAGRCKPEGDHADAFRLTRMALAVLAHSSDEDLGRMAGSVLQSFGRGDTFEQVRARRERRKPVQARIPEERPWAVGVASAVRAYANAEKDYLLYAVVHAILSRERALNEPLAPRPHVEPRVALFGDGLRDQNGVAETYRQVLPRLDGGVEAIAITCDEPFAGGVALERAVSMRIPEWPDLTLDLPRLSAALDVVSRMRASVVHVLGPGPLGLLGMAIGKILRLPVVASYHTALDSYVSARLEDPLATDVMRSLTRRFYAEATMVTAPSASAARSIAMAAALPEERVRIVHQGVDTERFSPMRSDSAGAGRPTVMTAGRLSAEKSIGRLVAAVKLIPSETRPKVVVAGTGPELDHLKATAEADTRFTGWLTVEGLARELSEATLYVCASATETAGQAILEAQAAGTPCVVSPNGAAWESIVPGVTGLVAEDDTPLAFATTIETLLRDRRALERLGCEARSFAETRRWDDAAQALKNVYREAGAIAHAKRHSHRGHRD